MHHDFARKKNFASKKEKKKSKEICHNRQKQN
jgi:hypothetical protein